MQTSSRLYHCCRCHAQVIICSRCDRGQRYCSGRCSESARSQSLKQAAKKYQSTPAGCFNNAARQKRFREQNQQKVTHQGSLKRSHHDLLKTCFTQPKKLSRPSFSDTTLHCHHCGAVCESFLRHNFLKSSRVKATLRRYEHF